MSIKPRTVVSLGSEDAVVQLADLFRLMGDPTRLRIILVCLDEPISVGARESPPAVTQSRANLAR